MFILCDAAQVIAVGLMTGRIASTSLLMLRAFKNNITPSETDTVSNFTECDFPGYAAIELTAGQWSVGNPSLYPLQTMTLNANIATQYAYGYYTTLKTGGGLWFAERFSDGPYPLTAAGNTLKITPVFGAASSIGT